MKRKSPTPWLPFSRLLLRLSDISFATWKHPFLLALCRWGRRLRGTCVPLDKLSGQIVRSNLFLLGHILSRLAGKTSITSYRYKSAPSPLPMMFKYETSKFSKHLFYMRALILMEEKWNAWYSKISITFVRTATGIASVLRLIYG